MCQSSESHVAGVSASADVVERRRQHAELVDVNHVKDIIACVRRKRAATTVHTHHSAFASASATVLASRRDPDGHVETYKARLGGVQLKWPELAR